jgi:hypothetical protein
MLYDNLGFRFQVSVFSSAAGCGAASQIGIETLKKRITNIEQGIMNFEVRYSIIRNFLFDILRFAVPTMYSFIRGFWCQDIALRFPVKPDTWNLLTAPLLPRWGCFTRVCFWKKPFNIQFSASGGSGLGPNEQGKVSPFPCWLRSDRINSDDLSF